MKIVELKKRLQSIRDMAPVQSVDITVDASSFPHHEFDGTNADLFIVVQVPSTNIILAMDESDEERDLSDVLVEAHLTIQDHLGLNPADVDPPEESS